MKVEFGVAARAHPDCERSGDAVVLRETDEGVLFGVIDVLGHGEDAADVADRATDVLQSLPLAGGLADLVHALHWGLVGTRGAAIGLALVRNDGLEVGIVGNIRVRSLGTKVGVVSSPGIVGRRLRKFTTAHFCMGRGDRVALFSDGLPAELDLGSTRTLCAQRASQALLRSLGSDRDDASVIIADFRP